MNKPKFGLYLILIILVISLASAQENTSNATQDIIVPPSQTTASSITLNLESSKFALDSNLEGTVIVEFIDKVSPEEKFRVTINGETTTHKLSTILDRLNYTAGYEAVEFEAVNPEKSKSLNVAKDGSSIIGIQVPRFSAIDALTFEISGELRGESYPSGTKIDVGNEGTSDWFYLGSFQDYTQETLVSQDWDGTDEGTGRIADAETYYCELIDLPLGNRFQVSASYTKLSNQGDIHAAILSVPTGNPSWGWSGGSDTCNLPESSGSCEITLQYPIEGTYMVCLYSEGESTEGEDLYSIPIDTSEETTTAFTCPKVEGSLCEETGFSNFPIEIQAGTYNDEMAGNTDLSDWETFSGALITGLRFYVGSEPFSGVCKTTICNVPINISSLTRGTVSVSDLAVTYEFGGVKQDTSTFYDLSLPTADITSIESGILDEGAKVQFNLEAFDLTQEVLGDYTVEIEFLGNTASEDFSILPADEVLDAQTLIAQASAKYKAFLDTGSEEYLVLSMLDKVQKVEQMVDDLTTFSKRVGFPGEEKILLTQVEALITNEPWDITFSETTTDLVAVEPSDIPTNLGEESEVYFMQDAIRVTGTKKTVEVETFAGDVDTYTFIHKEVLADETLEDASLYEISPISFGSIDFITRPKTTVANTAEYDLTLNQGSTQDYYYLSEQAHDLSDFNTIIVLSTPAIEEDIDTEPTFFCGDDICQVPFEDKNTCEADCKTGFPWIWVVLIILFAGFILVLINFKDKIFKKKKAAKKPSDAIVSYIQKALSNNQPETKIKADLQKRGWTAEQINTAMKKAKTTENRFQKVIKKKTIRKPKQKQPKKQRPLFQQ